MDDFRAIERRIERLEDDVKNVVGPLNNLEGTFREYKLTQERQHRENQDAMRVVFQEAQANKRWLLGTVAIGLLGIAVQVMRVVGHF